MHKPTHVSLFPYNGDQYLKNIAFDSKKNKGVEALVLVTLKKYLQQRNVHINTYDVDTGRRPDTYVYLDLPYPWDIAAWKTILFNRKQKILICNESSLIIPFNYWRVLHIFFKEVYTWYEPLIDNRKYLRIRWPKSSEGIDVSAKPFAKKKFLVIINKNTKPFSLFKIFGTFGKELYSWRLSAIDYFERTIPKEFDLYGRGWNKPKKYSISEWLFGYKRYTTYRGPVENKIKLLSQYKYCICFENLSDVDGYVTEKIFDCLKAKCVPIYWGASDITKYIPSNCFIDFRDFGDYDSLLNHLRSIDEPTYNTYIKNIEKLLSEKKFKGMWFEDWFAQFFYENVLETKNS